MKTWSWTWPRPRTWHVLLVTLHRVTILGTTVRRARLRPTFTPDPIHNCECIIHKAAVGGPGGGERRSHHRKLDCFSAAPQLSLCRPFPCCHWDSGKLVFRPSVGPASLRYTGTLWFVSSRIGILSPRSHHSIKSLRRCCALWSKPLLPPLPPPSGLWPHTWPTRDEFSEPRGLRARNVPQALQMRSASVKRNEANDQDGLRKTFPQSFANGPLMILHLL